MSLAAFFQRKQLEAQLLHGDLSRLSVEGKPLSEINEFSSKSLQRKSLKSSSFKEGESEAEKFLRLKMNNFLNE